MSSGALVGVAAGVLLIVGALTSLAAAGVIGILTVAFFSVHRAAGFWITARWRSAIALARAVTSWGR